MVWEHKSRVLVMLCGLKEDGKVNHIAGSVASFRVNANDQESCYQYWPAAVDSSTVYGRFKVKLTAEEKCDDFIVRKFQIGEDSPYLIPVGVNNSICALNAIVVDIGYT
jgi:hypothetical protein